MNLFINFWYNMVDTIQTTTAVLVIAVGLAGIFGITLFSIFKIKEKNAYLAIIIPVLVGCILMVPIISSFNNIVKLKIEGTIIDEAKAKIQAQRAEAERLRAENRVRTLEREKLDNQITIARQSIEIEVLNDQNKLLQSAQLSMQNFQRILQVALLETKIQQTTVKKEALNEIREATWLPWTVRNQDEILVILTHDINAKFGVDLNEIKVEKLDGNTVLVSGIQSKYIGADRNISAEILKEVRRVEYGRRPESSDESRVIIQNDPQSRSLADRRAKQFESEFQTKLGEGLELGFMNDAVDQLAKNFITVMLAPLYREIRFTDAVRPNALPVMEHIQKELEANHNRKIELLDINENLLLLNRQFETEAVGIESEENAD